MIYQLQSGDNLNTVSKLFGYEGPDGPKRFFKIMRYVGGAKVFLAGQVIEAPCEPTSPRDRPYNGQPHTDAGERGKTFVKGLTMRDIVDCYHRALALSSGDDNPKQYEIANSGSLDFDIYSLDLSNVDHGAVGQNLTCEIERMMGIFPNVPELKEGAIENKL